MCVVLLCFLVCCVCVCCVCVEAMDAREKVLALRATSKKLAALTTVLLSVTSVLLVYLLVLSADNHRLAVSLNKTRVNSSNNNNTDNINNSSVNTDNQTILQTKEEEDDEDDDELDVADLLAGDDEWLWRALPSAVSNSTLFLLRPHYSLFFSSDAHSRSSVLMSASSDSTVFLTLVWLCSPYFIYILLLQQHGFPPSILVASYALLLAVLAVLRALLQMCGGGNSRLLFWTRVVDASPARWLRGFGVRALVLSVLILHFSLRNLLSAQTQHILQNVFILCFISACFLRGKSFLALLWCLFVSGATQLSPFFRSSFALPWCPWLQGAGSCHIQVGEFFVVSEFLLFVCSPIRIVMH